ncbi:universal stress protein [Variovorax sp. GT1P44]|uniref:universal stress protein n=1 Tax=Variovorax sp. GT1P44 TaxID=3443742 RepID=UPI003F487B83
MLRNVLIAFDGSPHSENALSLSLDLAQGLNAKLHALAVIDLRHKRPQLELEAERRHTWQMLRGLEPVASRAGVSVEVHLAEGVPAEQIVLQARELHADVVVLGHRERSPLARLLAGSLEELVISHAPCAVMLAPPRQEERHAP